jgi:putative two-component system hydrogenase maturation factor HypX/HoxX
VADVMGHRLPVSAARAAELGLVDAVLPGAAPAFVAQALARARTLAASPLLDQSLQRKQARRAADEATKPLASYRSEELARMRRNFYGFDPSYHIARSNFVRRVAHSWTPRHLARHRGPGA